MQKKKYNPFKMWGSWVGVILGILFLGIITANSMPYYGQWNLFGEDNYKFCYPSDYYLHVNSLLGNSTISFISIADCINLTDFIFVIILGFFLGWGIHSLVRKMRK